MPLGVKSNEQKQPPWTGLIRHIKVLTFLFYLPDCSNLSEDIQQQYWQVMLAACRRYIQWYIAYWSAIKS